MYAINDCGITCTDPVDEKVLLDLEEEGTPVTLIRTDPDCIEVGILLYQL